MQKRTLIFLQKIPEYCEKRWKKSGVSGINEHIGARARHPQEEHKMSALAEPRQFVRKAKDASLPVRIARILIGLAFVAAVAYTVVAVA